MAFCDYHIHTCYSFDGDRSATPEAICKAAIERGLTDIAITDHFEVNAIPEGIDTPYDADAAFESVMQVKEIYGKRLNITYGIELGQASQYPDIANDFLRKYPVEFVLASLHNLRGKPDFYYMDFSTIDEDETSSLYRAYLSELLEMIDALDKIDAIGHITYPFRYIARAGKVVDASQFYDGLADIFSVLVKKDVALELNVSTYAKGYGFTMPTPDILSLYRECGGRLITLGTDAHSPSAVGIAIPYAAELAKSVGFDSALVIRGGQKELIKL